MRKELKTILENSVIETKKGYTLGGKTKMNLLEWVKENEVMIRKVNHKEEKYIISLSYGCQTHRAVTKLERVANQLFVMVLQKNLITGAKWKIKIENKTYKLN